MLKNKKSSVSIAKDRLCTLLSSDRTTCQSDLIPYMQEELYTVLSKYIELHKEKIEIQLTHSEIRIKY